MLSEQALDFLKVRTEEIRMVALVAALFLCIQAGQGIGENAAFGLFLGRVSVDRLPYMYMGLGAFVSAASLAYAASLSRFQGASVVTSLLAISVVLFLGQWAAISLFDLSIYSILWLTTYGMSVLLGTLLWTVAGGVCDARQAKRLFPLFTSMGILGSVLGNMLTGIFANVAGTDKLIILYAMLLATGYFLARRITGAYFERVPRSRKYSVMNDLRSGFDFVRGSRLFRIVALSSILYSVLFFTVDFPFSSILSNRFQGNEASLAGFKGLFTSVTTAITFLVSLLLANRLYARFGIIGSILIMPITYVIAFVVFFVSFTLSGAVFVRFAQLVVLGGVMGTAWNALFNVIPPERRGQVLAFNNGVPAQVGVLLSGILILLSRKLLGTQEILLLGAVVAGVTVYLTLQMKAAYGDALLGALRAGRVEVFSDQEEAFSGYQNDLEVVRVIQDALKHTKPSMRRLAVEMAAKMRNPALVPRLVDRLSDDDGSVRAAATRALADLGDYAALSHLIPGLEDPDPDVRAETLASLPKLGALASPELVGRLERSLRDPDAGVQAHAAVALMYMGETRLAHPRLEEMIRSSDVNRRQIALRSFSRVAAGSPVPVAIEAELLLCAFQDGFVAVRREGARAARYLQNDVIVTPLAQLLRDKDAAVRRRASESLKFLWSRTKGVLVEMLREPKGAALDDILDAIPAGDPQISSSVRDYIQQEVANLFFLRSTHETLPLGGKSVSLLADTIKYRQAKSEARLVKAVGLFGNPRALELISRSLNAGDASRRAAALEALETLGDRQITNEVLPILDRSGIFKRTADRRNLSSAIFELLDKDDPWLRALAARSLPELNLVDREGILWTLKSDKNPLVSQAARDALAQLEGERMKTLKTISTMDRMLLLREVPIFAGLTAEDLEQIAEVAQEQLYSGGSLICREGEQGSSLFLLVSGDVEVVKSIGAAETVLAVRGPGEFVGEMAILESAPRSATLRARSEVRVLSIEGDAFNMILLDRPEVAVSVLRNMSARVRELNQKVGAHG